MESRGTADELVVAAAASMLGRYAHIDAVAAVADLGLEETGEIIDRLSRANAVVSVAPIRLRQRGSTAPAQISGARRTLLQAAVARELRRRGAPRAEIASHLLGAPGSGDGASVAILCEQGEALMAVGKYEAAIRYLERATHEPPDEADLSRVLSLLAEALLADGRPEESLRAAQRAGTHAVSSDDRSRSVTAEFRAHIAAGAVERALDLIVAEIDALREVNEAAALRLEVALLRAAPLDARVLDEGLRRFREARWEVDHPEAGAYMLEAAQIAAMGGEASAAEAIALVEPALRVGFAARTDVTPVLRTVWLLARAEADEQANELLESLGRQHPQHADDPGIKAFAGYLELRFGLVEAAVDLLEEAFDYARATDGPGLPIARAFLAHALIESDLTERFDQLFGGHEFDDQDTNVWGAVFNVALGRRMGDRGAHSRGVEILWAVEEDKRRLKLPNPAGFDHLFHAVAMLLELGDLRRAREVAEINLKRAHTWGAPGNLALAELAAAKCVPPRKAVPLLQSAADRASDAKRSLPEAYARLELGRTLTALNRGQQASDSMRLALDAATRAGAAAPANHARRALADLGRRPRGLYARGVESLTTAERRVAEFAATGRTNREIAELAHLSVRTVENQLRAVYRKLDTDRKGLPEILDES